MQDITPKIAEGRKQLEAYGDGGFRVNGQKYGGSIVISPFFVESLNVEEISQVKEEDISKLISEQKDIEFLLVGSGEVSDFLLPEIERKLKENNIIIEYMATGAAARTYNILLSEERKFAAILIAV